MKKITEEEKNKRNSLFFKIVSIALLIVILLMMQCNGKKIKSMKKDLSDARFTIEQQDSAMNLAVNRINELESRKAIPAIIVSGPSGGTTVGAVLVSANDMRPESLFIKDVVIKIASKVSPPPAPVAVNLPCPPPVDQSSLLNKIASLESLNHNSINVELNKKYGDDKEQTLFAKSLTLNELNSNPIYFENKYIEYLPNPYRVKAQNNFWVGIGLAGGSAILYGISESLGHPVYIAGRDNSSSNNKHDQIQALRIGSALLGVASAIEFGRTVYFHNMETRFIINPTSVGLKININK
jgi:hypothetical protein